jgi:hypothetical protein
VSAWLTWDEAIAKVHRSRARIVEVVRFNGTLRVNVVRRDGTPFTLKVREKTP